MLIILTLVCSKDVRLPQQLQRAMAAEAEAAREARAKVGYIRAMSFDGHCWGHYSGTQSLFSSHFNSCDDGHQYMKTLGYSSSDAMQSQIAKFMGPTRGPPGSCRPQMGPMLTPWILLTGVTRQWWECTRIVSPAMATRTSISWRWWHNLQKYEWIQYESLVQKWISKSK